MKLLSLLATVFVVSFCTHKKTDTNCDKYKYGKFLLVMKPEGNKFEIERSGNTQTEYDLAKDSITGYIVKWTNSCEYELVKTYKKKKTITDTAQRSQIIKFANPKPLKVKITETTKKYYVFESSKDGISFVYRDTMWVVGLVGGFKPMGNVFPARE